MFSGYMSVSCPGETGGPSSTVTDDLIGLAAEAGNKAASAAANAGKTAAITQAANSKEADLLLHYDDRYIFEEEIDYIETVSVDSFAVGTESPDEFVLVQDGSGKVTARGCGRAKVYLKNGKTARSGLNLPLFHWYCLQGRATVKAAPWISAGWRSISSSGLYVKKARFTAVMLHRTSMGRICIMRWPGMRIRRE